ncbi:polyhydroxyalkanoate granule-associated protein [Xylographa pallens]|nr:polyhydroxyalkanoate granule-associated protein [Xylographa pallens]
MHFSHAVVLAFIAATASAQYGYSDRSYAGVARRYAYPAVGDDGPRRLYSGAQAMAPPPVRRWAYPEPEPILGYNHAAKAFHAAKKHFPGHHKKPDQAAAQGVQGTSVPADMAADPAAALGRRWAYPEPEAKIPMNGARKGHRAGMKHTHGHHKNSGQNAQKGAALAAAPAAAPAGAPAGALPAAAPGAADPASAPAADSAAAPAADSAAAPPPTKRWAILEAYSKLMARNAESEPENYDEIWERDAEPELEFEERDAEPELEFEERDAEPELEFEERDAEPELEFEERDAEPELDLEERDFDDELYSFIY